MNDWLARNFPLFPPDRATILAATRHLSAPSGRASFPRSRDHEDRRGEVVRVHHLRDHPPVRRRLTGDKTGRLQGPGREVPPAPGGPRPERLFYSRSGDIKVRGNGQDLAELDLLLVGGPFHRLREIVTPRRR